MQRSLIALLNVSLLIVLNTVPLLKMQACYFMVTTGWHERKENCSWDNQGSKGAHTRTSLARESPSWSLTREPGSDIFHHTRMSGFRLVTLHTRTSLTHWNPSPAGLARQTLTCMGTLSFEADGRRRVSKAHIVAPCLWL